MASTNKTTNYELSQFLGSDKPAWLSDYNADMAKIDAGMKANADGVTAVDGKADANGTKIGTLASLTTTDKTDLVSAINEVDGHADTAQSTANQANDTATTALGTANNLADYLNFTTFLPYTSSDMSLTGSGSIRSTGTGITVARNDDGTICKVYGTIVLNTTVGNSFTVTIPNTGLNTSSNINVNGAGFITSESANNVIWVDILKYTINTNGSITITVTPSTTFTTLRFIACVVFVKNFGD